MAAEPRVETSVDVLALERAVAGRYALERELGRGGMGVVLLARDLSLDRLVALKLLPTLLAAQPLLRERFLREARTAAGLAHPNIVPIHAVEAHDDLAFIAMGFVDGETLAERVRRRGPLPPREVARILREVAWALAYAHGRGIVHRDIKPDNILIERGSGRALVTDFGIARPVEGADRAAQRLTLEGQLLGTAAFMSPEQAAGEPVDGRSDLYSLGGVGFYALTGRAPFEARTIEALLVARFTQAAPTVTSARPDVPAALSAVIDRCLARQPYDRYATAEEVAEALAESVKGAGAQEIAPPVRSFLHAAEQTVWLSFMIVVFTIIYGLPTTRRLAPILFGIALGIAVVSIDLVRRARELLREGFGAEDVRRAFEIERQAHAEALRQLFDERRTAARRRTRRRAWIALGIGVVVRVALQLLFPHRPAGTPIAPWIVLFVLNDAVNTVSLVIAINASPRAERRAFRMAAWVWRRRFTNAYFRIAAIGIGRLTGERPAVEGSTPQARLADLIDGEPKARFPELPALIERLEHDQAALRLREAEVGRALADAGAGGARSEPGEAPPRVTAATTAGAPTAHALEDRRTALLAEMRGSLDELRARRAAIGAALENVRIQLLRVRAGIASTDDLHQEVEALRALVPSTPHSSMTARPVSLALLATLIALAPAGVAAQRAVLPYRDARLPVERRVDDLLARMTLEEKVAQMVAIWAGKTAITDSATGRFDPARAPRWFRVGIGRIERPSDRHGARAEAEFTNAIQRWMRDSTRLGIPVIFHEEALHGLQGPEATSFPQAIALASAWNPELTERIFATVAAEVRARGAQQVLAPVVDVARDPRWGRIEETYGEDPYLASRIGVAAVRGFQGAARLDGRTPSVPSDRVIATLKHLTGHGQPESGTNTGPAPLGENTLRNFFFPPFEAGVKEAHVGSIMPSYNELDGVPSHANAWMLRDVVRGEWGFEGTIVSDWFAIPELVARHHVAADSAEAARLALAATVDADLPDLTAYPHLVNEVKAGRVPQRAIDAAVRRLLRAKFALGLFENPFVDAARADSISGATAHRALAREAARQSIVLLRNEGGALPLRADALRRIAVIGPHAAEVLLGGYAGTPRFAVSIVEGIRARASGATVDYAEGVRLTEDSTFTREPQPHMGGVRSIERWQADRVVLGDSAQNERRIQEAVALARASDVAIVVVGDNEMTSREAWAENHLGDRESLGLVGQQEALVRAVQATGKPVVLVLINGRPLSIPRLASTVPAIVEGWYLGQETGTAIAEVLFGDVNPGGKLPVTVARDVGQLPMFYNRKPTARRGYLLGDTKPLWPFGHGLSYTTFGYGTPRLAAARIAATGRTTVSVDVTNSGTRAGDEVVQLYVRDRVSHVTRPVQELRGFRRVSLRPGETRTVSFDVDSRTLGYYGPAMKWVVEPGAFDLMLGGSSAQVKTVTLEVAGSAAR